MTLRSFGVAFAIMTIAATGTGLAGCGPAPPVKSAGGEEIKLIAIEEKFALSTETKETTFHGDRLNRLIGLLEKRKVFAKSAAFGAKGVVDTASVTITITPASGDVRRLLVNSCVEPNVCGALDDALAQNLIDKKPAACRASANCDSVTNPDSPAK